MIVVGYQGIGKSSIAGKNNFIDLESGNFWVDGQRSNDWYKPYCKIANHLSEQGYIVFTSSHEVVRNELEHSAERVIVVCPALNLKDEWILRLENRYRASQLEKDYKALMNAKDRYTENIRELMCGNIPCYTIDSMEYELGEFINSIINKPPTDDEQHTGHIMKRFLTVE